MTLEIDLVLTGTTLLWVDWFGILLVVVVGIDFDAVVEVTGIDVLTISFVGIGLILNILLEFCAYTTNTTQKNSVK